MKINPISRSISFWASCACLITLLALPRLGASQIAFDPGSIPGGLPDDISFPLLMSSDPITGAKNVPLDSPVTFTFLASMAPVQQIEWSGNVVSANFTYTWSADGTTLTCKYSGNFPANSTITWTLDPTVFKGADGTALLPFNNSGAFTTGSGQSNPNDPCSGGGSTNSNGGSLSLFKSVRYVQTSAAAPVVDGESGALFGASLSPSKTNAVSSATLQLPNGTSHELSSIPGGRLFYFTEQFATQEALDAAYPAGEYTVTLKQATGTGTFKLTMPANGAPPTPQITNFAQTQSFNPAADYTVQWGAFTGAGPTDTIYFLMSDETTTFSAPDPCVPRLLPNTATSITVPAGTFGAGGDLDGSIGFNRSGTFDTNSVPGMVAFSGYSKTTAFKPGGSTTTTPDQPTLVNFSRQPNGAVSFQVQGKAAMMTVESSVDLKTWTTIMQAPSPSGTLPVTDPMAAVMSQQFYRASAK